MIKWHTKFYIILFSLGHIGCSTEEPTVQSTWQLTSLQAKLDGTNLLELPISGFEPEIEGTSFSYSIKNSKKSGTWEINESRTSLDVEFDGVSYNYPIIVESPTEIQYIVKSLDITKSMSVAESQLIVMLNQKLQAAGSSWNSKAASGKNLEIILTLRNQ